MDHRGIEIDRRGLDRPAALQSRISSALALAKPALELTRAFIVL
jgi:hypothetical protein